MRTQVCIVGGGPSGLLLAKLLRNQGIDVRVLERKTRDYVLSRIRAGVLEVGFVELMRLAGVAERMDKEGFTHEATSIALNNDMFHVDFVQHTGTPVVIYGQTELTRDLYDALQAEGALIDFEVENVVIHDAKSDAPYVTYTDRDGRSVRLDCDFVAGCDGFHGVSRQTIPTTVRREYEKLYPFGWLGVLSETPPAYHELIYSCSDRGFALCSMRNANLSRYYIQCSLSDSPDDWSDDAFWQELKRRIPEQFADTIITGPSVEKSIAPLRSFVCEPMQWGRLFLCGDAAHIVPPTGAKGLNTAASDIHYLYYALLQHYKEKDSSGLEAYSEKALARIWKAERFSWSTTMLMHRFPDMSDFDLKMQVADLRFLQENEAAQRVFAENYVGLPY